MENFLLLEMSHQILFLCVTLMKGELKLVFVDKVLMHSFNWE